MKKLIIPFLLALFTGTHSYAQDTTLYRSYFGEEFTKWYIYADFPDAPLSNLIGIKKDSLISIDEKEYKKAKFYWDEEMTEQGYRDDCYLREEHDSGKLYCVDASGRINEGKEFLVSDLTLQQGDTFRFVIDETWDFDEGLFHDSIGYYTLVDSIYYQDNRKHIRTTLIESMYYNIPFTFIEGLGPNYSIFLFLDSFFWSYSLACYHTENEFWKSEEFWLTYYPTTPTISKDCLINYLSIEKISQAAPFKVIANPGSIELLFETGINGRVALYDMQARQLQQKETNLELSISIPTGNLTAGVYLLWVFDREANRTWTEKIIIK